MMRSGDGRSRYDDANTNALARVTIGDGLDPMMQLVDASRPQAAHERWHFIGIDILKFLLLLLFSMISNLAIAGYDVHVTRKPHWADTKGPRITFAEWQSYVEGDGAVQLDKQNTGNNFIVSVGDESFPLWYEPKFGELRTKDPSKKVVAKLVEIAAKLKAKVQGDDGELYSKK